MILVHLNIYHLFFLKFNGFQVKEYIIESLMKESEPYLGMAVTFTLIEYAKEHLDDLLKDQNEAAVLAAETSELRVDDSESESDESKNGMFGMKGKTQMTKAQKRRMWDRTDASKHGQMVR
ncbi:unnamed protein product [Anisakis simplex]|uniref:CBFD_NFYB_HMF domain-containing protein n=1 Tax=Anisakis simplex TaxID=6269 RepID=A0A0M3K5B5_ANISI|nr:unnamed protein product [Anisakis simplex]